LLTFVGWTLVAIMFSFEAQLRPADLDRSPGWAHAIGWRLAGWWSWAAFTPVVCWWTAWLRRVRLPLAVTGHLLGGSAVVVLCAVVQGLSRWAVGLYHPSQGLADGIGMVVRAYWPFNVVVYITVVGLYLALTYAREAQAREGRTARLETQLVQARLDALTARLQPHFLFNTLHAISAFVAEDAKVANQMIARLAELLRLTLSRARTPLVTLEQELELLDHYVAIQEVRFSDRLRVRTHIEPGAEAARVPTMLLQPLVENAIRHSIGDGLGGGGGGGGGPAVVEIDGRRSGDRLLLEVSDNGPGFLAPADDTGGEGLRNTRERLQQLYGDHHLLRLTNGAAGGARVVIEVPFEEERAGADR
jgi:LytS/YehU family sensor histidine kinase